MEKIFKHFRSPDGVDKAEGNLEKKEQLGTLAYVPLFRGNALYNAMFPEVTPLFQAGEEPDAKIILQEIFKHKDEKIITDGTVENELYKLTQEDIKEILPDAEIKYYQNGNLDVMSSIKPIFEKENITLSGNLDSKISKSQNEQFFSSEDAKEFISLINNQVPDCNRVIIALESLSSHVLNLHHLNTRFDSDEKANKEKEYQTLCLKYPIDTVSVQIDPLLEKTKNISKLKELIGKFPDAEVHIEGTKKTTELIVAVLSEQIRNSLRIEPEFIIDNINLATLDDKTVIIYDRHNKLSNEMKLEEKIPQQTILMPLETGIHHAQKIGALKSIDGDYALSKRRLFEKKEE